jgi:hypothetical protein
MPRKRGRGRPPDLERRRLAAALRARGLSLTEIGQQLGISRQGASYLVNPRDRATRRRKQNARSG